jgi:hypothetical protein
MNSPQKKFFITPHACPNGRSFEGSSPTKNVGSNPTGGMDVVCVVRYRSLWRADHLSREVLLSVVRLCVWSRNLVNEEAMPHCGGYCTQKSNKLWLSSSFFVEKLILYVQCATLLCTETTECGKSALFYDAATLPTFPRLLSFTPTFNAPQFRKPRCRNMGSSRTISHGLHNLLYGGKKQM